MYRRTVLPLALVAAAAVAAPAQASFPGQNGLLAYERTYWTAPNTIGTTGPFMSGPDGELIWPHIPTGPVDEPRNVAWSPDGARLAFDGPATPPATGRALYVMNADGSGLRQVGRGDRLRYNPSWSPDGRKLAFVQDNGKGAGSGDIYTMTTTGSSLRRLTTSAAWDSAPDWAPDGTRIAYTCSSGGRTQVCQMTPTGASKTVTTRSLTLSGRVKSASWSPDGASIAFAAADGDYSRIYRMSRSGGSLRVLHTPDVAADVGALRSPAWSPDGTRIAYQLYFCCGEGELLTMRATDGGDVRRILGNDGDFPLDPGGWQPKP